MHTGTHARHWPLAATPFRVADEGLAPRFTREPEASAAQARLRAERGPPKRHADGRLSRSRLIWQAGQFAVQLSAC